MNECVFCKIISGIIPASKVYSDEKNIAFLDIAPANKGHIIVIPKNHAETITELSDEDLASLIKAVKKVAKALLDEFDGVNVLQNNKKAAGQLVPHLHFHVIPRNSGDGLDIAHWKPLKYADGEMQEYQDTIKSLLRQ